MLIKMNSYIEEEGDLEKPLVQDLKYSINQPGIIEEIKEDLSNGIHLKKNGPYIGNMQITRYLKHNSLNQPPVYTRSFRHVRFLIFAHFIVNLLVFVIQNIWMFSSSSFSEMIQRVPGNDNECNGKGFSIFLAMIIISELGVLYSVILPYLLFELVYRRNDQQVQTYRYNR